MKRTASEGKRSGGSGISAARRRRGGRSQAEFVVCVANPGYPASLELHKIYRVVPDTQAAQDGDVRVIDECGEDYLYPARWFETVELPGRLRRSLQRAR